MGWGEPNRRSVARTIGTTAPVQDDEGMAPPSAAPEDVGPAAERSSPSAPDVPHGGMTDGSPHRGHGAHDGTTEGGEATTGQLRSARSLLAEVVRAPVAARTWREYLHLAAAAPVALTAFVTLTTFAGFGLLLSLSLVGVPLLALGVLGAREYGAIPRALARELLGEHVEAPRRRRPRRPGFFPWLRASLGDIDGWRAIAYVVVAFPVTLAGASAVALVLAIAVVMLTYPVYWQLIDTAQTGPDGVVHDSAMQFGEFYIETWPRALAVAAIGLVVMFVVPWLARLFTTLDRLLVRGLLGPSRITSRIDDLEVTRAHAVDDSAATLRRIERDLHDGTQARLVALAMHLDMARQRLAGDPVDPAVAADPADPDVVRARELLDQAHHNATEAITELREVTRSIHPPALDRGLDDALTTLAARSGVPAEVATRLSVRPSPAIETITYFCAAELLTNVAKHSGARAASVDVFDHDGLLRLRVTDDGTGGARVVAGSGLAGLAERLRTVDGRLHLTSPEGGPTMVTVELPVTA